MSRKKSQSNQSGESPSLKIFVVAIPVIGTIIVALFNFPPFQKLFDPLPTVTITATTESIVTTTPTDTSVVTDPSKAGPTSTETRIPLPTGTFTLVPPTRTATATLTPVPSLPIGMQVILDANSTSGKAPLLVKFNAKRSFFRDPAGEVFPCGACNFTWQIRQGSKNVYGPEKGQGTFEFKFGAKGTYFVTVVVCRSHSTTDCAGTGAQIVVK